MKPYYEHGGIVIYHADCREILPTLGKVDAVVTDPPYLIHAGHGGGCFGGRDHLVNTGGFTDSGCDYSFLSPFPNWICFCSRAQLIELLIIASTGGCRWNLITWAKPNPVPTCHNKYLPDVEYIVHRFQSGRLFGDMADKPSFIICPCGNKETDHPNEKPIRVIQKLISLSTQENETILDPFMGSGTTLRAAKDMNRQAIGIELEEKYCEIAARRMEQEVFDFSESK